MGIHLYSLNPISPYLSLYGLDDHDISLLDPSLTNIGRSVRIKVDLVQITILEVPT